MTQDTDVINKEQALDAAEQGTKAEQAQESVKQVNTEEAERIAQERSSRAERAALKSYFKQQGLTEQEAQQALEDFKTKREAEEAAKRNDLVHLQDKVAAFEKQESEQMRMANLRLIRSEAMVQAMGLNIRPDRVDYAIRLADLSKVTVDEQGNPDEAAIREALTQVTKDLPELTNQKDETQSGFKLGAPGQQTDKGALNSKLASIFGVNEK